MVNRPPPAQQHHAPLAQPKPPTDSQAKPQMQMDWCICERDITICWMGGLCQGIRGAGIGRVSCP